jgi:hypothetical protein
MYDYERTASVKTAMQGSLWAGIHDVLTDFAEKLANDLVKHLPSGWKVKDVFGGAMNQMSSSASFENVAENSAINLYLSLGGDLHVVGFAALTIGRGGPKSNIKIGFDSFSSPENVARHVGGELNKLFAADATMSRLMSAAAWAPPPINKSLVHEIAKKVDRHFVDDLLNEHLTGKNWRIKLKDAIGKAVAPKQMRDLVDAQPVMKKWLDGLDDHALGFIRDSLEEVLNKGKAVQYHSKPDAWKASSEEPFTRLARADIQALSEFQAVVSHAEKALHDTMRKIIAIQEPVQRWETYDVFKDMLKLEITDYQKTLGEVEKELTALDRVYGYH